MRALIWQRLHLGSDLYSIVNGKIIGKGFQTGGYGNYVIMKDETTKKAWLYGHMREPSPLNIGDSVQYGDYVGHEGETGFTTGIHVHLAGEYLGDSNTWRFGLSISQMLNPATEIIGIPNQAGITAIYNGTPRPFRRNKNKWLKYMCKNYNIKL